MRYIVPLLVFFVLGCSVDQLNGEGSLDAFTEDVEIVLDNVIACAASNEDETTISVFLYPREGASNIQYFETESAAVDKNDFKAYRPKSFPLTDVFNGYLKKFDLPDTEEKWVIVSFDEDGKRHLSNPIRLKQKTKPTEYLPEKVMIDSTSTMPIFSWQDGMYTDTKIYFQVVTDATNKFLSGTYTFDKRFQYYNLDNVVLNITRDSPPELLSNTTYGFSLLAVSEDNWVNQFAQFQFKVE